MEPKATGRSSRSSVVRALGGTFFSGQCHLLQQGKHFGCVFFKEPPIEKTGNMKQQASTVTFNVAPEELGFKLKSLLIPMATNRSRQLMRHAACMKPPPSPASSRPRIQCESPETVCTLQKSLFQTVRWLPTSKRSSAGIQKGGVPPEGRRNPEGKRTPK